MTKWLPVYRSNSFHTARALLQEMTETDGITVEEMLQSHYLTKSDIALFRKVSCHGNLKILFIHRVIIVD